MELNLIKTKFNSKNEVLSIWGRYSQREVFGQMKVMSMR